jgi:tetratricopeptide (TPR) repeat protein
MCIVIVLTLQGCSVYFNTYYNAETAFREGNTAHQKALRNFPDSIVVQPPPEAMAKYDRAVEKAAKVLEVFPKDKKWHDDALFLLGKTCFYKKEFAKSIRRLRQLQEEYPQSGFVPESYVYMAKDLIGQEELAKAEETLQFALDRYPSLDKDQSVSLLLVEIAIRREGRAQAIVLLEKATSGVQSPEKKQELILRLAELHMSMQQYDKAIKLLQEAPRRKKDPLREYRIDRDIVLCHIETGAFEKALDLIKTMLASKLYVPYTRDILYVKGRILADQGNIDGAITAFKLIIAGSGDTTAIRNDTALVVGRALYELGLLYQKKKGSYSEAEKYFRQVKERPARDSLVTQSAERRFKAMNDLKEWRLKLASKDTAVNRMQALFAIGELFCYELDEPDSSLRTFTAIASGSVRDTLYTPKSLCAAASIARRKFGDTLLSDSLYNLLITEFPGSDYVRQARRDLFAAAGVKTRKESAEESFHTAEKTWVEGNDVKTAVNRYYDIYRNFGDLDIAPKSLFVAAWLTDNELQKKKTAKKLYEKICDRYPQSLYCTDEAKPRLKTVLDTLEALRKLRKAKTGDTAQTAPTPTAAGTNTSGSAATPASPDTLDENASLPDDSTILAPEGIPPAPIPDTGDARSRKPGYRGRIPVGKQNQGEGSP